jgi:hypothetical protein
MDLRASGGTLSSTLILSKQSAFIKMKSELVDFPQDDGDPVHPKTQIDSYFYYTLRTS